MIEDNTHTNAWGHLSKEKSNSTLRNNRYTWYYASDISGHRWYSYLVWLVRQWQLFLMIACVTTLFLFLSINILYSAKLLSVYSIQKVVLMAEPNKSTMKHVIQVVSECYSILQLNPSVGSSDCIYFQNLSESSNIEFHTHSLSSTLARWIILVLFKIQKRK